VVAYPSVEKVRVVDPKTLQDVPRDGLTMGGVITRANTNMRGRLHHTLWGHTIIAVSITHPSHLTRMERRIAQPPDVEAN
jgi:hypothetical protein